MFKLSFRRFSQLALAAILITSYSDTAVAASSKTVNDSLAVVSRQMFAERNEYFILAEALKDGYLKQGQDYSFSYADDVILVNGARLPAAAESRYKKLIQDFYANGSSAVPPGSWIMQSSGKTLLEDLLNPASEMRRRGPWHHTNRKPGKQLILEELARDRIVDTSGSLQLSYTREALLINGRKLSPALDEKYRMLIRILEGFEPSKETDSFSIRKD